MARSLFFLYDAQIWDYQLKGDSGEGSKTEKNVDGNWRPNPSTSANQLPALQREEIFDPGKKSLKCSLWKKNVHLRKHLLWNSASKIGKY
ncbi:hypothetical protein E2320_013031 [Naja naja]|nr:hypothetical protein E2320_013031 [Naja naja]